MYADSSRRQNKRVGNYVVIYAKENYLGRGHCPFPENFSILSLTMAIFSAFWALAHVAREGGDWPLPAPLDLPVVISHESNCCLWIYGYYWRPSCGVHINGVNRFAGSWVDQVFH